MIQNFWYYSGWFYRQNSILPHTKYANICELAKKQHNYFNVYFTQRITSVTITKNNGGNIACECSKIRENLRFGILGTHLYALAC